MRRAASRVAHPITSAHYRRGGSRFAIFFSGPAKPFTLPAFNPVDPPFVDEGIWLALGPDCDPLVAVSAAEIQPDERRLRGARRRPSAALSGARRPFVEIKLTIRENPQLRFGSHFSHTSIAILTLRSPSHTSASTMAEADVRESLREIEVEWGDLDSLGIVFYPRMFAWADAAAHQLFRAAGVPMDRLLERGMGFGLVSASASFQSPARYGERLVCRSVVSKLGGKTLDLTHRLVRAAGGGAVATFRETRVCMDVRDAAAIRAQPVPDDVVAALRSHLAEESPTERKE